MISPMLLSAQQVKELCPAPHGGQDKVFPLNSRYCDDAIMKASEVLKSCREGGKNPEKVVFGSRKLFEKLKKNHLTGKRKEKLKKSGKRRDREQPIQEETGQRKET